MTTSYVQGRVSGRVVTSYVQGRVSGSVATSYVQGRVSGSGATGYVQGRVSGSGATGYVQDRVSDFDSRAIDMNNSILFHLAHFLAADMIQKFFLLKTGHRTLY